MKQRVALWVCVLIGIGLRFAWLPQEAAGYDEWCSLTYLGAPSLPAFFAQSGVPQDDTIQFMKGAPVFFVLEYCWARAFGTSLIAMRLLPVLFAVLSVPVFALLVRRLFGTFAAAVATWCFAVAQIHLYYGQEIRPYSMMTFLALVSLYTLVRGLEGSPRWWLVHGSVNVLLVFTHLFGIPWLFAEFLFLVLVRRRSGKRLASWVGGHAVLGGVLTAWVFSVDHDSLHREVTLYHRPSLHDIANVYLTFAGGRVSQLSPKEFLPGQINLDPLLGLLYLAAVAWQGWTLWRRPSAIPQSEWAKALTARESFGLLLLCLTAPMALVVVMSYALQPALNARYLVYSSLAMYALVGGGIAALRHGAPRRLAVLTLVLLSAYQTLAMVRGPFRADYRSAAQRIEREAGETDKIVVMKGLNLIPMRRYWSGDIARLELAGSEQQLFDLTDEGTRLGRTVWVVLWRWDSLERWEAHANAEGRTFTRTVLGGMPPLYVYRLTAPPPMSE